MSDVIAIAQKEAIERLMRELADSHKVNAEMAVDIARLDKLCADLKASRKRLTVHCRGQADRASRAEDDVIARDFEITRLKAELAEALTALPPTQASPRTHKARQRPPSPLHGHVTAQP